MTKKIIHFISKEGPVWREKNAEDCLFEELAINQKRIREEREKGLSIDNVIDGMEK